MISFQVELDEELAEAVRQLAVAQDRSASELVQDAVSAYMRVRPKLPKGTGQYRSGANDGSENARQILRTAVEEGKWL